MWLSLPYSMSQEHILIITKIASIGVIVISAHFIYGLILRRYGRETTGLGGGTTIDRISWENIVVVIRLIRVETMIGMSDTQAEMIHVRVELHFGNGLWVVCERSNSVYSWVVRHRVAYYQRLMVKMLQVMDVMRWCSLLKRRWSRILLALFLFIKQKFHLKKLTTKI